MMGELLFSRADLNILLRHVAEVLLAERFGFEVIGFGNVTVISALSHSRVPQGP
jgi:hypothetical protein